MSDNAYKAHPSVAEEIRQMIKAEYESERKQKQEKEVKHTFAEFLDIEKSYFCGSDRDTP